jgi:hypothetical protein
MLTFSKMFFLGGFEMACVGTALSSFQTTMSEPTITTAFIINKESLTKGHAHAAKFTGS